MITIKDMGYFINLELKNPPKRGTRYFGTNVIIHSKGIRNIVKGKLVIQTYRRDCNAFWKRIKWFECKG